ncbi:spore germination protein [Paenibacillus thermotolerans]|uniref:spore germination protein n=1 Tax=Paenibacillus thermotolerans TaxID=3027807 RepID=UPI002367A52A|nr:MULTISPECIES: spore germination protein [unclassified Paenibacillus]
MPAIVGNIKILSVGSSGIVQFGDALFLVPRSTSKTFSGSGSFNTGDFPVTNSGVNMTQTWDPDLIDSSVTKGVGPL